MSASRTSGRMAAKSELVYWNLRHINISFFLLMTVLLLSHHIRLQNQVRFPLSQDILLHFILLMGSNQAFMYEQAFVDILYIQHNDLFILVSVLIEYLLLEIDVLAILTKSGIEVSFGVKAIRFHVLLVSFVSFLGYAWVFHWFNKGLFISYH